MTFEETETRRSTTYTDADGGPEGELLQSLVGLEPLAIGIAHELNMPIQYVADSVQFLKMAFESVMALHCEYKKAFSALDTRGIREVDWTGVTRAEAAADLVFLQEQVPKAFERTLEGVDAIAGMVQAMKAFARPRRLSKAPVDINKMLLQMLALGRNEYKYVASVQVELGAIPPVVGHVGDLSRVFLWLVVYAASQIAASRGKREELGHILVRTAHGGEMVLIEIKHRGVGGSEPGRPKLEPSSVFTTQPGERPAQVLDVIRSIIVDDHAGTFDLKADSETRATSLIRLPIDEKCRVRTEDVS